MNQSTAKKAVPRDILALVTMIRSTIDFFSREYSESKIEYMKDEAEIIFADTLNHMMSILDRMMYRLAKEYNSTKDEMGLKFDSCHGIVQTINEPNKKQNNQRIKTAGESIDADYISFNLPSDWQKLYTTIILNITPHLICDAKGVNGKKDGLLKCDMIKTDYRGHLSDCHLFFILKKLRNMTCHKFGCSLGNVTGVSGTLDGKLFRTFNPTEKQYFIESSADFNKKYIIIDPDFGTLHVYELLIKMLWLIHKLWGEIAGTICGYDNLPILDAITVLLMNSCSPEKHR